MTDHVRAIDAPLLPQVVEDAKRFMTKYKQDDLHQIALQRPATMSTTDPERFTLGCGSLLGAVHTSRDFDTLNDEAAWVKPFIEAAETHSGMKACRARLMTMLPNRCLSYHIDTEPIRYHLVVETNPGAMFIVDDVMYRMPTVGAVYRLRTDVWHTALNATLMKHRTHIVLCMV